LERPIFWDTFDQLLSPDQLAGLLADATGRKSEVVPVPLPPDLKDNFGAAAWRRPECYLDERYRANTSSFRTADPDAVERSTVRLADDLDSGAWECRQGEVLQLAELDAGYRLVFTGRLGGSDQ